ncbi:MAG: sulfate adenylyltransferase, partial [Planctomycetia bacterium]|nr:sulfate adenylyltransferase [Planctomycetia bacterium]
MADLIPPHGGVAEPINRTVAMLDPLSSDQIPVSDADLSTLYRIADGGLSPLVGPMGKEEYNRVLEEEVIVRNGKKYAWTIPLAFPVDEAKAKHLHIGTAHPLTNEQNEVVGTITVQDVHPWDKKKYNASVYGTTREDHPGARIANSDPRTYLVGGEVRVLPQKKNREYGDLILSSRETRALFQKKGFQRVVAFQTRNALHRAHEYALVVGLERLTREGHFAGAVLNPLVGETKSDDVDAATRMKTYRALIDGKALGQGDTDEELWKKVGRPFIDHVLLIALDIKMFYAGPKEAVMHAIYRQNFGFTDIIIGRKHADAPFDDKTDIWDGLAAQRKFDELKGELLINPVKVGFAAYYAELGRVGLVEEHAPKGWKPVNISGTELREKLKRGELPDPGIMRPETARVLAEKYKAMG